MQMAMYLLLLLLLCICCLGIIQLPRLRVAETGCRPICRYAECPCATAEQEQQS